MRKKVMQISLLAGAAILFLAITGIMVLPHLHPIKVTWGSMPYEYIVYGDYVEITRYTGDEEEVVIPDTILFRPVREIGTSYQGFYYETSPFENVQSIKSVYIPDSVTEMGRGCFEECTSLERIRLSPNLTMLPRDVFYGCESLKEIEIPEGITKLGFRAFCKCTSLETVVFPNTLKIIGSSTFTKCTSLVEVDIPETVEEIHWDAFKETGYAESWEENYIICGKNVLVAYCGEDTVVEVPEGVEYIGEYVFDWCEEMEQLVLPESVRQCEETIHCCKNLQYIVVKNPDMIFPDNEDFIITCPKAKLIGAKGSTTETYAKQYGYDFLEELPEN